MQTEHILGWGSDGKPSLTQVTERVVGFPSQPKNDILAAVQHITTQSNALLLAYSHRGFSTCPRHVHVVPDLQVQGSSPDQGRDLCLSLRVV